MRILRIALICLFSFIVCKIFVQAHEIEVHKGISSRAMRLSIPFNSFVKEVSEEGAEIMFEQFGKKLNPAGWVIEGSAREDDNNQDEGGRRSFGHFYDPLSHLGLSSQPGPNGFLGPNSYEWAWERNSRGIPSKAQPQATRNVYTWQNARDYQYRSLTRTLPAEREASSAYFYRALGQVIHLLQDASQPQHVRNEHHWDKYPYVGVSTPWRSPIEMFGADYVNLLNYSAAALDWRGLGSRRCGTFGIGTATITY